MWKQTVLFCLVLDFGAFGIFLPSTAQSGCFTESDYNYRGFDLGAPVRQANWKACRESARGVANAHYWTFRFSDRLCFIKSSNIYRIAEGRGVLISGNTGCREGCWTEPDYNYPLFDLGAPVKQADWIACRDSAVGIANAHYWTFRFSDRLCWLKSSNIFRQAEGKGVLISGNAGCREEDCKCGVRNTKRGKRIVNGPETKTNEYPWQVALWHKYNGQLQCGGSLISSETVLTAAHCVLEYNSELNYVRSSTVDQFRVIVGAHDVRVKNNQWIKIKEILVNEGWIGPKFFNYDFALLTLAEPVTLSMHTVRPICLPSSQKPSTSYENIQAIATGWGQPVSGDLFEPATFLRQATVTTMSENDCKRARTPRNITSNMICAYSATEWTCNGDSGGPLIAEESGTNNQSYYSQIGVVSFSSRYVNGTKNSNNETINYCRDTADGPGVYARVTAQLKWIKKNMQGTTCPHP